MAKKAAKKTVRTPPEPAKDPALGTKTPAWLEWAKEHNPEALEGLHTNWKGSN